MKEKYKVTNYPSKNMKTETYKVGEVFVTKHYYDAKDAYIRELIHVEEGVKEVKHFSVKGVLAKVEYFVKELRHGIETKYSLAKADKSVKSTKTYENGKLHGECITYNDNGEIIKQEVYANGKTVIKYVRNDANKITNIQILDQENSLNLPIAEREKLQENMQKNPEWFK
ncbi:hypothetical protein KJ870_02080 [bacterium]|nr:hypothetical protein [bacterium]MBU1433706.1 hypothetical protein [bacterium]MBU1503781.1 hypothetical protein [bacterium]